MGWAPLLEAQLRMRLELLDVAISNLMFTQTRMGMRTGEF